MIRRGDLVQPGPLANADLQQFRLAFRADLAELKCSLLKWVISLMIVQTAVIVVSVTLILQH